MTPKTRRLHLASARDSGDVIVPLMPGGHPLVSRHSKKGASKMFQMAFKR